MNVKEYKIFRSASKTAKENNLVIADGISGGCKRLFDFSLLEGMEISEREKDIIKECALKYSMVSNPESLYGKCFNNFSSCSGRALYYVQRVYSIDGRRLYNIFHLGKIEHKSAMRKSVYEDFIVTTYQEISQYTGFDDIEIA